MFSYSELWRHMSRDRRFIKADLGVINIILYVYDIKTELTLIILIFSGQKKLSQIN